MSIPLGQLLATFEEKDMMVYLVAINVKNSTFTTGSGAVTGVVSDDFRTITLLVTNRHVRRFLLSER